MTIPLPQRLLPLARAQTGPSRDGVATGSSTRCAPASRLPSGTRSLSARETPPDPRSADSPCPECPPFVPPPFAPRKLHSAACPPTSIWVQPVGTTSRKSERRTAGLRYLFPCLRPARTQVSKGCSPRRPQLLTRGPVLTVQTPRLSGSW